MTKAAFQLTYDYRCPFARNVHEHVIEALDNGAEWDIDFIPFSLSQTHVEEGGTPVWDDPEAAPDRLAAEVSIVVRDRFPEAFRKVHIGLFTARHDESKDLRSPDVIAEVLSESGLDPQVILGEVKEGWPTDVFRETHTKSVDEHQVFGVPTFVYGDDAVFVRVMTRPQGNAEFATETIEGVVTLLAGSPDLNEYKHTKIRR